MDSDDSPYIRTDAQQRKFNPIWYVAIGGTIVLAVALGLGLGLRNKGTGDTTTSNSDPLNPDSGRIEEGTGGTQPNPDGGGGGPAEPVPDKPAGPGNVTTMTSCLIVAPGNKGVIIDEKGGSVEVGDVQNYLEKTFAEQYLKSAEFGNKRVQVFLRTGEHSLTANVGYFTIIAGHETDISKTIVRGKIEVPNKPGCVGALDNFTRGINHFTIIVPNQGTNFFRTSQACPIRGMTIGGNFAPAEATPEGNCNGGSGGYSSGGYIANMMGSGELLLSTQQQFYVRNSTFAAVRAGAWNIVLQGVNAKIPSTPCPSSSTQYTAELSPKDRLILVPRVAYDGGKYVLQRPIVQSTTNAGPIDRIEGTTFWTDKGLHIWQPLDTPEMIQKVYLDKGTSVVIPARVIHLTVPLRLKKPYTALVGLGFATLVPDTGKAAIIVHDEAAGCIISGILVRAGPGEKSDVLVQVGTTPNKGGNLTNPTVLVDVFIRVGGPKGYDDASAGTMLEINQRGTLLDHTHLWRADHSYNGGHGGLGPTKAVCDYCLVVNGHDVLGRGIFAEHSLREQVLWKGDRGRIDFFQSELPYDVAGSWDFPSLRVTGANFNIRGGGIYCYFEQKWQSSSNPPPSVTTAIDLTKAMDATFSRVCTYFLDGAGSIKSVVKTQNETLGDPVTTAKRGPRWVC